MPEANWPELNDAELAFEAKLAMLLTLPRPSSQMDRRILAAAEERCEQARAQQERAPRGLLYRLRWPLAAAASVLVAAMVGAMTAPVAVHYTDLAQESGPLLSSLGDARVVDAEGALGEHAQPKLSDSYVHSGEPLSVQPGGFLALALACGTRLVLDGGGAARLAFDRRERRIRLERGRLYAKVVKVGTTRETRPIVIESPGGRTRVLGTELMVRSSAARSHVTVRAGQVRLENRHGAALVAARHGGLLAADAAPRGRRLASVDRHFRWIGKLQRGPRHPTEKPFGGEPLGDEEPAIGTLAARLPDGTRTRLRLAHQEIETDVADGLATTTVRLTFRNDAAHDLEGVFRFALPKQASITRYAVSIAGELVEGQVVERERARAIYRQQKRREQDPALLEWSRGSAFTARVFPIKARATKRIVLAYTQELAERHGRSRLVVPLVSEASRAHPPERLSLRVRLGGAEAGAAVACPSHYVTAGPGRVVRLQAEGLRPRNDFVLELARPRAPPAEGWIEETPGEPSSVLVRVRPDLGRAPEAQARAPLIVLCDASGSQRGSLKEVQLELLEGLLADTPSSPRAPRVFLSHVETDELRPAPGLPLREGLLVALWRAPTAGAQDLARAFHRLRQRIPADAGATLVYLGDGVTTAGGRSDAFVARALQRALPRGAVRRVVTVGIGADVNQGLLERLARDRDGVFVGVRPGDDLRLKLDDVRAALVEPVLTQLQARVELEGFLAVAPRAPRNLRAGETLSLSGRLMGSARSGAVVLSGLLGGRVFRQRIPLDLQTASPDSRRLAALWARRRVSDLREQGPRAKEQILDLALRYGIVTPYTSLLVLKERELARYRLTRRQAVAPRVAQILRLVYALQARGDLAAARRGLLLAVNKAPHDPRVQLALRLLRAGEGKQAALTSSAETRRLERAGPAAARADWFTDEKLGLARNRKDPARVSARVRFVTEARRAIQDATRLLDRHQRGLARRSFDQSLKALKKDTQLDAKHKRLLAEARAAAQRYEKAVRTPERWGKLPARVRNGAWRVTEEGRKALGESTTSQSLYREGDKGRDAELEYSDAFLNGALVDSVLGRGTRQGYVFQTQGQTEAAVDDFMWYSVANPTLKGTTGDRHFSVNHDGVTYYTNVYGLVRRLRATAEGPVARLTDLTTALEQDVAALRETYTKTRERLRQKELRIAEQPANGLDFSVVRAPRNLNIAGIPELSAALEASLSAARQAPWYQVYQAAGAAWLQRGDKRAAWRAYSGMIEARPDSPQAHLRYARALLRLGLVRLAYAELLEAARLSPAGPRRQELARLAAALLKQIKALRAPTGR